MSDDEQGRSRAAQLRIGFMSVVLFALVAGGLVFASGRGGPTETFCKPALPFATVHGEKVAVQTASDSQGGECPVPKSGGVGDMPTLGFDCKVRDQHGKDIDSIPTPKSGTCGNKNESQSSP